MSPITKILNGAGIAQKRNMLLREKILRSREKPLLAVVLVGHDPASRAYQEFQHIATHDVGVMLETIVFSDDVAERKLLRLLKKLSDSKAVYGILLQHSIPEHFQDMHLRMALDVRKDVDCIHPRNLGLLALGKPLVVPSVTRAIQTLIASTTMVVHNSNVLIIGTDDILAKPTALSLINDGARVTLCHHTDENLAKKTLSADIVISCSNVPHLVKAGMVRSNAMVIDAGGTLYAGRVVGDVDFEKLQGHVRYVSPVPGGLEALTTNALLENTWGCMYLLNKKL